jgi:hypothetical protein
MVATIHFIVALADLFNLSLLLLDESVQRPQIQLLRVIVLDGLDERCKSFKILCCR